MLQAFRRLLHPRVMPYYAVKTGRKPGVYSTWTECQTQVDKFTGARYKKFNTENQAWDFVNDSVGHIQTSRQTAEPTPPQQNIGVPPSFGNTVESVRAPNTLHEHITSTSFPPQNLRASAAHSTSVGAEVPQAVRTMNDHQSRPVQANSKTLLSLKHVVKSMKKAHQQMHQYITQADEFIQELQQQGTSGGHKRTRSPSPSETLTTLQQKRTRVDGVAGRGIHTSAGARTEDGASTSGNKTAVVYTDGCCVNNGKPDARAGIGVYWGPGDLGNTAQRLSGRPTNNRAEIHAAVHAIRQAKRRGHEHLLVRTDSQFMINSITKWIHKWKANGWILSNGNPVANREDFEELDQAQRGITVEWEHVRGHQGIEGNEEADRLANEGATKQLFE